MGGKESPATLAVLMEEQTEDEISPSYKPPQPNLPSTGNLAEGETSITPKGGVTLAGVACITSSSVTTEATQATVVHGDAAVFANTSRRHLGLRVPAGADAAERAARFARTKGDGGDRAHGRKCRDALERLHPPLRQRLEGKRFLPAWGDFTRNEKIGIVSAALTGLSLVLLS
jgi:hypothetical protein